MGESAENNRARFEWRAFGRTLVVWLVDFCCAAGVVAAVWCFVRHCVFEGERIPATAHDVSEVLDAIAWPSALVLLVSLFRNPLLRILNELPTFVRRSYYRHGKDLGQGTLIPDDGSVALSKQEDDPDGDKASSVFRFPSDAEEKVGKTLSYKYGGQYYLNRCIGNRRYIFDVVVETPNRLLGVELKASRNLSVWSDIFHRVQLIYEDCSERIKSSFVFVPVVAVDEIKAEVERMAANFAFKTVVEVFPYERK